MAMYEGDISGLSRQDRRRMGRGVRAREETAHDVYRRLLREYSRNEEMMRGLLPRLDRAIHALKKDISGKLQQHQLEDEYGLLDPLTVYEHNKSNPYRNRYAVLRRDLQQRGVIAIQEPSGFTIDDVMYFSLALLKDDEGFAAAFEPSGRTLRVSDRFSLSNLLDVVVSYHELDHALQDGQVRKNLRSQEEEESYHRFYSPIPGTRPRIVGVFEQQAYLKELFVTDLLTDGRFKADMLTGTAQVDDYVQQLRARPSQRGIVEVLIQLGERAFSTGSTPDSIHPDFASLVNTKYRDAGFDIYEIGSSGSLQRVG